MNPKQYSKIINGIAYYEVYQVLFFIFENWNYMREYIFSATSRISIEKKRVWEKFYFSSDSSMQSNVTSHVAQGRSILILKYCIISKCCFGNVFLVNIKTSKVFWQHKLFLFQYWRKGGGGRIEEHMVSSSFWFRVC